MSKAGELEAGQTVRLTMPYLDAERGVYTVVYVYRDGWLCVQAHGDGRRHNVPEQVCRQVAARVKCAAQSPGAR